MVFWYVEQNTSSFVCKFNKKLNAFLDKLDNN